MEELQIGLISVFLSSFFLLFFVPTFHLNNITFHCFIVSVCYQLQSSILLLPYAFNFCCKNYKRGDKF